MTVINLDEQYRIKFDGQQYMPESFSYGGIEIKAGKHKGELSKPKWVHSGKYYGKLELAVKWCVNDHMSSLDDITMDHFIERYQQITERLINSSKV